MRSCSFKRKYGFSICNPKDSWDKKRGRQIAIKRAELNNIENKIHDMYRKANLRPTPRISSLINTIAIVREIAEKYDFDKFDKK